MKLSISLLFIIGVVCLLPRMSHATEEYAQKTGQSCGVCHVDPAGRGELTKAGRAYQSRKMPIPA